MAMRDLTVTEQPASALPARLFGEEGPAGIVQAAAAVAAALAPVIEKQQLYTVISGRRHVRVEGWSLLGTMLGVFPVPVWSRPIDGGFEARVEARTMAGALVGAAEAQCTRDEPTWRDRPDFALRSMAQTRATSKALRLPLGFVMTLAGYDATPAEEMDGANGRIAALQGTARAPQPQRTATAPALTGPPRPDAEPLGDAYRGRPLYTVAGVACYQPAGKEYLQATIKCLTHDTPYFCPLKGDAVFAHGKGEARCVLVLAADGDADVIDGDLLDPAGMDDDA